MGAFPVFVVDGEPSPLKSQARAARFFRGSGVDLPASSSAEADGEASAPAPVKARNAMFMQCVKDCVVSSHVCANFVSTFSRFRILFWFRKLG